VIGQIRAEQGFLPDARTNFLTYAERMQRDGDLDESFRALIEFCDLAPDDVGVRVTVAEQMVSQGRTEEALGQLLIVHRHYTQLGETSEAEEISSKILAIDPEADLSALPAMEAYGSSSLEDDGEAFIHFGEIAVDDAAFGSAVAEVEAEAGGALADAMEEASTDAAAEVVTELGHFSITVDDSDDEDEVVELPMMGFDDDEPSAVADDEGDSFELPTMAFGDEEASPSTEVETTGLDLETEGEPVELPMMEVDDFGDEEEAVELPMMEIEGFDDEESSGVLMSGIESASGVGFEVDSSVEEALEEAAGDLGTIPEPEAIAEPQPIAAPERFAEPEPIPEPVAEPEPIPEHEPVAEPEVVAEAPAPPKDEGFIDLGAMILGTGGEKSTRFTVAYEEPSGDEEADFAKMLSQFKDKVSENLDSSDVRAHYDLGTAYKEMGLLDEAIGSFQAALRASADHLPTYEVMGQTFIEMGQPEAAVKSLERALETPSTIEDELVGIYYYLGRAYEQLQNRDSAVEFYDRVFSLDINFADVTERLRELR
jgi:tetratricopeptide (TPR) repeat protein